LETIIVSSDGDKGTGVSDGKLDGFPEVGELDGLLMDGLLLKEGVSDGKLDGLDDNVGGAVMSCDLTWWSMIRLLRRAQMNRIDWILE
jgi:hypothetical protein